MENESRVIIVGATESSEAPITRSRVRVPDHISVHWRELPLGGTLPPMNIRLHGISFYTSDTNKGYIVHIMGSA